MLLEAHPGPLVTTELVIAEAGWLIDRQLGAAAEAALYESAAAGEIRVGPLSVADWTRIAALTVQYADQHLGGVDSSLIAVAERLSATSIGTLDRRHFRHRPPEAHHWLRPASVSQSRSLTTASFAGVHGPVPDRRGSAPPHPSLKDTTPTTCTLSL